MPKPDEFVAWALSPQRTIEEAYCAERLVEEGYLHWCRTNGGGSRSSLKQSAAAKRRRLNPAHRARLNKTIVTRAAEALAASSCLSMDAHHDRPLRDLQALRFFPQLKILSLHGHEFNNISVLRALPALESVSISSDELEDFSPLAELSALKVLHLHVRQPWPSLKGLDGLTALEIFQWTGNVLPLEEISRFGKVRVAKLHLGTAGGVPLRDLTRLPEMPWLEELELDGVHHLDGITRWPRLRNLTIGGDFKDLVPLTGLRGLTHLILKGELTRDLAPLAQLSELRRLIVRSEHPHDYSVLAETPRLHEVVAEGCRINRMELATLHAVLSPWDEEFAAPEPRERVPCRFRIRAPDAMPGNPRSAPGARWEEDAGMKSSEIHWFQESLENALGSLFGCERWGRVWSVSGGVASLSLHKVEAAEQLADIVERTRELLSRTILPWHVHVSVNLCEERGETDKVDSTGNGEEGEEEAVRRQLEDYRNHQKRRAEVEAYLEREHRMRLLTQAGKRIDPEDFAPVEELGLYAPTESGDVESEATVPAPAEGQLWMQGVITEDGFFADVRGRAAAEHLMGRTAEGEAA